MPSWQNRRLSCVVEAAEASAAEEDPVVLSDVDLVGSRWPQAAAKTHPGILRMDP